jgi:hypothetical protein
MKRAKFCDLPPGTRFNFQGRTYTKLRLNLAKGDDQVRIVFPTDAVVETSARKGGPDDCPASDLSDPIP